MSSVYGMKVAVSEMKEEAKSLIDYALKQSISLDYLGSLDPEDLKAMPGLKRMSQALNDFLTEGSSVLADICEKQREIDKKLDEISKKLEAKDE